MNSFFASLFITVCVVIVFFVVVRYSTIKDDIYPIVRFEEVQGKLYLEFEDYNKNKDGDEPFLIDGYLSAEGGHYLYLTVRYYLPEGNNNTYSFAMYPQKHDFYNNDNVLSPGLNTMSIELTFSPRSSWKRWDHEKYMTIYLNKRVGVKKTELVYARRIHYPKNWKRKPSLVQPILKASRFHTVTQ